MRLLKQKIYGKTRSPPLPKQEEVEENSEGTPPNPEPVRTPKIQKKTIKKKDVSISKASQSSMKKESQPSSKNIVKNYGKAMCNFVCTDLSKPYRKEIFLEEKINYKNFKSFILTRKEMIESIESLRSLLLVDENDTKEVASFKRTYQYLCLVFLKYFAVNWVYHSKVTHKLAHVKARFKLMRRIKNPQYFTYLKDFLR